MIRHSLVSWLTALSMHRIVDGVDRPYSMSNEGIGHVPHYKDIMWILIMCNHVRTGVQPMPCSMCCTPNPLHYGSITELISSLNYVWSQPWCTYNGRGYFKLSHDQYSQDKSAVRFIQIKILIYKCSLCCFCFKLCHNL